MSEQTPGGDNRNILQRAVEAWQNAQDEKERRRLQKEAEDLAQKGFNESTEADGFGHPFLGIGKKNK